METCLKNATEVVNNKREKNCGRPVYCGQDLRELIGMPIREVSSDDNDSCVSVLLEDEDSQTTLYFADSCFDGEHMKIVDESAEGNGISLRAVTEDDLQEFSEMQRYYDAGIFDANDEKIGVSHVYCNDIALEGTDEFLIKRLEVFYDGRILTEE